MLRASGAMDSDADEFSSSCEEEPAEGHLGDERNVEEADMADPAWQAAPELDSQVQLYSPPLLLDSSQYLFALRSQVTINGDHCHVNTEDLAIRKHGLCPHAPPFSVLPHASMPFAAPCI